MGKAKRFELLFPEEKAHLLAKTHIFLDTVWFQVVQVKYDLIMSNFPFLGFMENIWRFELHQQTNLDVNDWVLPWTCEFNWDKFRCLLANMGVEQTKRTCESRKEDWSMNTEIFRQEKGGMRILQTFANDTFLFD
jgi:hypothetical protein